MSAIIADHYVRGVSAPGLVAGDSMVMVFGRDEATSTSQAWLYGLVEGEMTQIANAPMTNPLTEFGVSTSLHETWFNPEVHPDGGVVHVGLYGADGARKLGGGRYYWQDVETLVREPYDEIDVPDYEYAYFMKDYIWLSKLNDNNNSTGAGWQIRSIRDFSLIASGGQFLYENFDMQAETDGVSEAYMSPSVCVRNTLYWRGKAVGRAQTWWYGARFDDTGVIDTFELAGYSPYAEPNTAHYTSSRVMEALRTANTHTNFRTRQNDPWFIFSNLNATTGVHTFDRRGAAVDEYGSLHVFNAAPWSSNQNRTPSAGASQTSYMIMSAIRFPNASEVEEGDTCTMNWISNQFEPHTPFEYYIGRGSVTLPATGTGAVTTSTFTGTEEAVVFAHGAETSHAVATSPFNVGQDDVVYGLSYLISGSSSRSVATSEDAGDTWAIERYIRDFSGGYQSSLTPYTGIGPVPGPWHDIDLSTSEFYDPAFKYPTAEGDSTAFYVAPNIVAGPGAFYFLGLEEDIDWDNGSDYQFEITLARNSGLYGGNEFSIHRVSANTQESHDAFLSSMIGQLPTDTNLLRRVIVGPGVEGYDFANSAGWNALDFILGPGDLAATAQETSPAISAIRWRELPPGSDPGPDPDPVYPPPGPLSIDVYMTQSRNIRNGPGTEWDFDVFDDAPFSIEEDLAKSATFIYPTKYEGEWSSGTGFYPDTPEGYVLDHVTAFIKAYTTDGTQVDIEEDTSGWGYLPFPTKAPFLIVQSEYIFEDFPAGTTPDDPILCGASLDVEDEDLFPGMFQSPIYIVNGGEAITNPKITVTDYGWRFTYVYNGNIQLEPTGAYADGTAPFEPTVVGTQPVLSDTSNATYVESQEDEFPYTYQLEPLVGYEAGMDISLHIRLSVTGDGFPADAHGEVFIATSGGVANSADEIGGFSDGTASGFGFNIPEVDGTIQDLVVPLSMTAWAPNTEADVVAALEAGAYLDFNMINNNNWDTAPTIKVYRAWVQLDQP